MLSFAGLLDWPECVNVRDVGGLPAGDGHIRSGALVRADNLLRLTGEGIAALRGYDVGRIIDLRASWELSAGGHPLANDPAYRRISFIDEERDGERDPDSEHTYGDLYRGSLTRNGRQIARIVAEIVAAPPGAVVVHCVSGADRTGMLVAILLDVTGVDRADIESDYGRSQECLSAADPDVNKSHPLRYDGSATILEALEFLDREYGGPREYLLRHGVGKAELQALCARLID